MTDIERLSEAMQRVAPNGLPAGVSAAEAAQGLALLAPHINNAIGYVVDAFAELRAMLKEVLAPFVRHIDLHAAARAKGRRRRQLIDQIARERGVRPAEIRRQVSALRSAIHD